MKMANRQLNLDIHEDTLTHNKSILLKLHGCSDKIHNKTSDEWQKLFDKLNNHNVNKNIRTDWRKQRICNNTCATVTQQQTSVEPIYGPIQGFPSGYWWGIRMDCSRDQVHSPFDNDIQQGPFGVASICTSHSNTTNDVDLGTLLTFTGRQYTSANMDDPLMHNYYNNIPLRLVRSYNLINKFAPKTGYRYDGLYIIVSSWIGVSSNSNKYHKFALARLNYQDPPSWLLQSKQRTSQRISSSILRNTNATAQQYGSLRCHMYSCQTQEPQKKKRKIIHHRPRNQQQQQQQQQQLQLQQSKLKKINTASSIKSTEIQRNVNQSTIVMRHVSKKCETIGFVQGYGMNHQSIESPIQVGNFILPSSTKSSSTKLQNTNISIRTELYDSSPNAQQDMKKTTPMTICRIYKANNLQPATIVSSHPTTRFCAINANPLEPYIKSKVNEQSQTQSHTGIHKLHDSPIANTTDCTIDTTTLKHNLNIKTHMSTPAITDVSDNNVTPEYNSNSSSNQNIKEFKRDVEDNFDDNLTSVNRLVMNSRRYSNTSSSSTDSSIKKSQLPEAVVTIETMTPEQLLSLIVKKRYNPTGKLLIGSIIGLPPENFAKNETFPQSTINSHDNLHTNNVITSQKYQSSGTHTTTLNFNDKFYESSSSVSAVPIDNMENTKIDKKIKFKRLKHLQITNSYNLIPQSNVIEDIDSLQKFNKINTIDKTAKPFSKSTTMKKRRGELANLMIDANFTTKICTHAIQTRTMSRRLRSPTIILQKRKEFKGFITNYTTFDSSKMKKQLRSRMKTNNSKNHQLQKKIGGEPTKDISDDFTKSNKANGQMNYECNKKKSRSLRQGIYCKQYKHYNPRMVDAMTQCSLHNEFFVPDDKKSYNNNCNGKSVKIEWIDLVNSNDDIKYESESNESAKKIVHHDNEISKFTNHSCISEKMRTKNPKTSNRNSTFPSDTSQNKCLSVNSNKNSMSAFAAVDLPDGDLRIARLRSIGFKPIEPCLHYNNDTLHICNKDCNNVTNHLTAMVINRDVDEQYNKYTSEENNIVGYMDHELHYQDIEAEASGEQSKNNSEFFNNYKCTKNVRIKNSVKNNRDIRRTNLRSRDKSLKQQINENNMDLGGEMSPWLGWN